MGAMAIADLVKTTLGPKGMVSFFYLNVFQTKNHVQFTIILSPFGHGFVKLLGQDKILQSTGRGHEVTVTNDGATILKSLHIDNAAAKVLVGILTIAYICMMIVTEWKFSSC